MKSAFARCVVITTSALIASSSLLVSGCSSSSQQAVDRSEKTVDGIAEFRKQIAAANTQLTKTMAALDNVVSGTGDRKAAFTTYSKEVASLQKQGEDAKSRSESLQSRAKEYVAKWQKDVSTVTNPELKAQADARRAQIQDRIDEVQVNAKAAGDAYRPLMKELVDIQTVLANDLTPANIQGVASVAANARQNAAALKKSLDGFVAELDSLIAGIGPKAAG